MTNKGLEARIEALEKIVFSNRFPPATPSYELPPGEYTQEEILERFPHLTPRTIVKHLPYTRTRKRWPMSGFRKVWIYTVPGTLRGSVTLEVR